MKSKFTFIPIGQLEPSPYQTRRKLGEIADLAASIAAHGLLNPVTCRQVGEERYELIAGHRRWEAAKAAGLKEIVANVIECDDRTAAELCVTENMQRVNLHPLEEAAGIKALLSAGHSGNEVAARLGRTPQWVLRRACLVCLAEALQEECLNPESAWHYAAIATLEQIAALPRGLQLKLFQQRDPLTPSQTASRIGQEMRELKEAPFDTAACLECPKRTGAQPDLFGETDALGRCLDSACYQAKRRGHFEALAAELKAQQPELVVTSSTYLSYGEKLPKGFEARWEFQPAKRGEPGAVPNCEVNLDTGKLERKWVRPWERPSRRVEPEPTEQQQQMFDYVRALIARIEATLAPGESAEDGFRLPLPAGAEQPFRAPHLTKLGTVLNIVAATGLHYSNEWLRTDESIWEGVGKIGTMQQSLDRLWEGVAQVLLERLGCHSPLRCLNEYLEALHVSRVIFDVAEAEAPVTLAEVQALLAAEEAEEAGDDADDDDDGDDGDSDDGDDEEEVGDGQNA